VVPEGRTVILVGQGAMAVHNAQNYQYQRGIAELVQKNLMPQVQFGQADLDVGHRYLPAKQVGGDYYDVFHLHDGRLGILMADVAGKSVQAAVHTAKGKYYIRAIGYDAPSPADVMTRTNALIHADTTIETFISAFYAVLEQDGRTVHYCNAGHPPPLVMRRNGDIAETEQPDILLGILPSSAYTERTVTLEPGDMMVLMTDGVTEARGETGMYGCESLCKCVQSNLGLDAQSMADAIVHDVLRYSGTRTRDDIAVLVIRVP
jgi:sigma-B regulation protein RsbU (phosphoserine phosphatase)